MRSPSGYAKAAAWVEEAPTCGDVLLMSISDICAPNSTRYPRIRVLISVMTPVSRHSGTFFQSVSAFSDQFLVSRVASGSFVSLALRTVAPLSLNVRSWITHISSFLSIAPTGDTRNPIIFFASSLALLEPLSPAKHNVRSSPLALKGKQDYASRQLQKGVKPALPS